MEPTFSTRMSFGWKRKAADHKDDNTNKKKKVWSDNDSDDDEHNTSQNTSSHTDCTALEDLSLEERVKKAKLMKEKGISLAEHDRFGSAIDAWNTALTLTPTDITLYDMKAQALLSLDEGYAAVKCCEQAVKLSPTWPPVWQTLGRSQLSMPGQLHMALRSFSICVHLDPTNGEVWSEDIKWVRELLMRRREAKKSEREKSSSRCVDEGENPSLDVDSDSSGSESEQEMDGE